MRTSMIIALMATTAFSLPQVTTTNLTQTTSFTQTPTCTLNIFANGLGGCTSYASTVTSTSYTDCAGCALVTPRLGGPVCMNVTSLNSTVTKTEVACAEASGYKI